MDSETQKTIGAVATACAEELVAQGWISDGGAYHLGAYPGDAEALARELGRELTRNEVLALEKLIRVHLDGGDVRAALAGL